MLLDYPINILVVNSLTIGLVLKLQLALGFVMLEPLIATNDDLSKLFFECKDYVVAICQGGAWTDKLDDLCQVLTISMNRFKRFNVSYLYMLGKSQNIDAAVT